MRGWAGDPFEGDGEVRDLARSLDWGGTALGPVDTWSTTLRDIVRAALESPFPINLWCGPELVLIYNDAYREVLGAKHPWSFGRSGTEVWAEIWPEIAPMFEQIRAGGPPVYQDDAPFVVIRDADGVATGLSPPLSSETNAWFTFSLSAVRDDRGELVAFLNVVSETTGRILAERARQEARLEAERANMAKSQFLATMSHEIRTPINAVIGYADLLDAGVSGSLSDAQKDYVDAIRTSSKHLLTLVSDVLDLAKIEAGEMKAELTEVTAKPSVASALRLVAPQARRAGLTLEEEWRCDEDVEVLGDGDRIRQILLNLLANALKFTDAGGTVTIRCRSEPAAPQDVTLPELGPWLVVDVEDTGRGIPAEQLARVFEPFVQADASHTRRSGGTGLGLTISRRLARLMGGELTVRSRVGEGSCFSLWLARARQQSVAAAEPDADSTPWPSAEGAAAGLASAGRTLLGVVEEVEERWVERLRSDPRIGSVVRMTRAQMANQAAVLIAALARMLEVLESAESDPHLVEDAETLQTLVATRHGRQRRRLGWTIEEVRQEYRLLGEVLDAALRRHAPKRTAADLGDALAVVGRLVGLMAAASVAAMEESPARGGSEGRR